MRVVVLNGNPDMSNTAFEGYVNHLSDELTSGGHAVTVFELREMDIKYCTGCFGCWVKTPGECVVKDESLDVRRAVINADFVLWASPVIMGFYSSLLKKVTDKFIPLVCPYATFVRAESHHMARYDQYPVTGLLLEKGAEADDEDISIISDIHGRMALNLRSISSFTRLTLDAVGEVASAITKVPEAGKGEGR